MKKKATLNESLLKIISNYFNNGNLFQVEKERERVKKINSTATTSSSTMVKPFTAPEFSVISKFVLDTELAAYVLTIELQVIDDCSPCRIFFVTSPYLI